MNDIYFCICKLLRFCDIFYISQVNKTFYGITKSESLWKYFYENIRDDFDIIDTYYNTCKTFTLLLILDNKFHMYRNFNDLIKLDKIELPRGPGIKDVPSEISILQNLRSVTWQYNGIKDFPMGILILTNLTHLDLRGNNISIIPSEICKLSNLTMLNY